MFVKVCGLKNFEQIDWAIELGYSAIGVVLHPKSVRYCTVQDAKKLAEYAKGKIISVAVGMTFDEISDVYYDFNFAQLYEFKNIDRLIYAGCSLPEPKITSGVDYKYFIYDVSIGSGEFHELPKWLSKINKNLIISGGLKAENVNKIINEYKPFGVDVSSGVEIDRGIKDYNLMKKFILEVNDAVK